MFIAQAYKSLNDFWRYLVGSMLIFFASLIGQMPLVVAIIFKKGPNALQGIDETAIYSTLSKNLTFFLILISFVFALGGILFAVKFLHQQKFKDMVTTRPRFDWSRAWFAFVLVTLYTVIMTLAAYFYSPEDMLLTFDPVPFAILFVIAILLVPIQTSVEEFVFRGYLMQGFGILAKNRWFPLVMTSVIFGGMHYFNPEIGAMGDIVMVFYIGTGFLLGIMTLMDEGMELALGFHAGNNLITALLVTADWTAFQTDSIFKDISDPRADFTDVLPVFIIYPIFLGILAYKYKWTGWKEKLFGPVEPPQQPSLEDHLAAD
ncbi:MULTISPECIES: CPBP family intramembrane glutamic endopeptidase [unclassified Leeuwenhoekiella]|uniref:CPBP family intramembrane glutamic endopeptidase n=1 Tax=unclassified Leeuwenhoekiella TaxID=2615029 RepID=UPI000C5144F2|nr:MULTISPECIES: CPBP family intramembrane glutamic endopeptidase [unclassified Leeuwenhoekiella]MAW96717.1 CPBP family intramembrane metalloprotease domain-containing protein [Leeuwenhoekiella sp.]MBA81606.1 CPBP family intramembrane metalloprotease domain-containing protein [Leeuwenhoekiella sp.]|tara:strand:- start:41970 stop:42923 length:954 start_codon:yes stop_codon:yes gene_type:complete